MVRALQAGVGWWGIRYVTTFTPSVPGVEMVGFVARSEKSKAALAASGVAPELIYPDLETALRETGPDLFINATKTDQHYALMKLALEMGVHVRTEKPFASTVAEAQELVMIAARRDLFLGIAENFRFDPAAIEAQRLLRAGTYGEVTRIRLDYRKHLKTMGFDYPYPEIPHPVLADFAIHTFEQMRWLLDDEPVRVSARSWNIPGNVLRGHPIATATVEFAKGTLATLDGSYLSTGRETAWGGEWTMDMADGEIWWTSRDGLDRLTMTPLGGVAEEVALPSPQYQDTAGALHAMVEAIKTRRAPADFVAGSDNVKSLAISEAAIISSSRNGDWVALAEVFG